MTGYKGGCIEMIVRLAGLQYDGPMDTVLLLALPLGCKWRVTGV